MPFGSFVVAPHTSSGVAQSITVPCYLQPPACLRACASIPILRPSKCIALAIYGELSRPLADHFGAGTVLIRLHCLHKRPTLSSPASSTPQRPSWCLPTVSPHWKRTRKRHRCPKAMRSPRRATRDEERPEAGEHGGPSTLQATSSQRQLASKTPPAVDCRSPRAKGIAPMHFRSRTLSSPGDLSGELLLASAPLPGTMEDEVASLHRALAESREEAQLAARIGQTLLERNQEMDAEIERQDIAVRRRLLTCPLLLLRATTLTMLLCVL